MDYRNERDALRGRVENLEQELAEAKRAQRGEDKDARLERIEKQLQELGRELAALKGPPRPPSVEDAAQAPMSGWFKVFWVGFFLLLPGLFSFCGVTVNDVPVEPESSFRLAVVVTSLSVVLMITGLALGARANARSARGEIGSHVDARAAERGPDD